MCVPGPTTKKSPEVEEMEVVTAQLSQKLHIEDIDTIDSDNPQLCAEYVKEIYEYMMMLEVSLMLVPQVPCTIALCMYYGLWLFRLRS